jgi:hypothetical protein
MSSIVKRSASNGSNANGSGGTMTLPTSSNAKTTSMGYSLSFSTTALRKDPAALLARGYTARYLGAVLQGYNSHNNKAFNSSTPSVTPLSADEIDRDLRHICAYQEAATRYHQLTYAATNHIPINTSSSNGTNNNETSNHPSDAVGSNSTDTPAVTQFYATAALPVRIDPEEEKRRLTAQKRIQRAEAVREELEQHYVALRAHYVVTTQELQQLSQESERTIDYLQNVVSSTASVVGYQRARLQMTRDVATALRHRTNILSGEVEMSSSGTVISTPASNEERQSMLSQGSDTNTDVLTSTSSSGGSTSDHQHPMLAAWTAIEDECKRHFAGSTTNNKGATTKGTKGKPAAAAIIPWACTKEPATSRGVPILLSALSTKPEKSIAIQTGSIFGSHPYSLTWLESHLPPLVDEDGEDTVKAELDAIQLLQTEVNNLEIELLRERQANQDILIKTGHVRSLHDEWVAMIALVRQETEAVLHRHNVLLESDEVRDAITTAATTSSSTNAAIAVSSSTVMASSMTAPRTHKSDEHDDEDGELNDVDEGGKEAAHGVGIVTLATGKVQNDTTALDEDGASEADDEGMEEEGEEGDDWDTNNNASSSTNNNKRGASAGLTAEATGNEDFEGSPGGIRKRRKL